MRRQPQTILVVLSCSLWVVASAADIDFTRDIQPILATHCLLCHGPDAAQGGLRLHAQADAITELDSGAQAIVPGRPETSELLARVRSHDPLVQMPPEGERLTPEKIAKLEAWIAEGASWDVHWAYRPLTDPVPPAVEPPDAMLTPSTASCGPRWSRTASSRLPKRAAQR